MHEHSWKPSDYFTTFFNLFTIPYVVVWIYYNYPDYILILILKITIFTLILHKYLKDSMLNYVPKEIQHMYMQALEIVKIILGFG